ncbi:MAG: hypothetical protein A2832_01310 [Candidatus Zambryskibacteria bacterium RIFCSPHIGHO2_01_FULL_44_22b]|uniref:Peptidase M15B domain-containing protein n=2 Tax=Candidatus Zambryskiibacteriota TaxID=1817925 RepID=A0A1G2T179_9BACT|nr:MAG: hypothetical protein A2832_01310 [Candidatus Zambryskibacteria bacterium RIFCSPHIGHO2_01_FULL_44_22b]OHB05803.1 MAG: hypothetical protein A3B16_00410 [Candidatus Zambryskibacteria bacterium RIFCSPLOWO2_01_FULL_45_43]
MNQLLAQATEYGLLAPLPGVTVAGSQATSTFATYIPGIFNLIIGIAGVLAVVMIIYGGIQYMSTDAFQGKSDAKNTISNAIWGLILTISAWLILYTVNPNLVNFNLNIEKQDLGAALEMVVLTTPEELKSDTDVRGELRDAGFFAAPPCTPGVTTRCVNLNGLQRATIDGLKALHAKYPYQHGTITITGGTEGGHTTGSVHDRGRGVDLQANTPLNTTITLNSNDITEPSNKGQLRACHTYTNPNFPGRFLWEPKNAKCGEVVSTGNHWHVTY